MILGSGAAGLIFAVGRLMEGEWNLRTMVLTPAEAG